MTRATSTGGRFEGPDGFGYIDRGMVAWTLEGWTAYRPGAGEGQEFPTWRAAMDYALGLDTTSETP